MPALTPATDPMYLLAPAGRRPLLQRPGEPARHAPGHSRSAPGRGIARGFTLVELAMVLVILAVVLVTTGLVSIGWPLLASGAVATACAALGSWGQDGGADQPHQ